MWNCNSATVWSPCKIGFTAGNCHFKPFYSLFVACCFYFLSLTLFSHLCHCPYYSLVFPLEEYEAASLNNVPLTFLLVWFVCLEYLRDFDYWLGRLFTLFECFICCCSLPFIICIFFSLNRCIITSSTSTVCIFTKSGHWTIVARTICLTNIMSANNLWTGDCEFRRKTVLSKWMQE